MRGENYQYMPGAGRMTESVERLKRENEQLKLARIQNGAEPSHQNGHPKDAEKGRCCGGGCKGGAK